MASSPDSPDALLAALAARISSENPPRSSSDSSIATTSTTDSTEIGHGDNEEKALESHEVIELQAFSERKEWIVEKIKFLEQLPPIQVFTGLDAVKASSTDMPPGLPTRDELAQWVVEHDRIEKETEIFDSGELKKLRKFTKAAASRNMSPQDTDLVELTLTTIFELDKLLHLLRDRSENLESLGIRLTWEEKRTTAWTDRAGIISDLQHFLESRARWSPSVYEHISTAVHTPQDVGQDLEHEPLRRRGSIVSLNSLHSIDSGSITEGHPGFSRAARFKYAEHLSRDAAQHSGRLTALRHGKITVAGKALDQLIDSSRRPVPDELLDEQDRLEEKGITEMENVGKFVMSVVIQFKKADEVYVDAAKDQNSAQTLLEEIETAKLNHPIAKQSRDYATRAAMLAKRVATRGDPSVLRSTFPSPQHPLFPDQADANRQIATTLANEVASTRDIVRKVEQASRSYQEGVEAIQRVEALRKEAGEVSTRFTHFMAQLRDGIESSDGDGSPPDLQNEKSLKETRHAAFLTLLPSLWREMDAATRAADELLRDSHLALARLDRCAGVDAQFSANAADTFKALATTRDEAVAGRADMQARVDALRQARKLWAVMAQSLVELDGIHVAISEEMVQQRWRRQSGSGNRDDVPITPEDSPQPAVSQAMTTPAVARERMEAAETRRALEVPPGLIALAESKWMEMQFFTRSAAGLDSRAQGLESLMKTWEALRGQAGVMEGVRDETHVLQLQAEELKLRFDASIRDLYEKDEDVEDTETSRADLDQSLSSFKASVSTFTDGLSSRIPFLASQESVQQLANPPTSRRFLKVEDVDLYALQETAGFQSSMEPKSVDDTVRMDSNSYAMSLAGEVQSLERKRDHLTLARMAKEADAAVECIAKDIREVSDELLKLKHALAEPPEGDNVDLAQHLAHLGKEVEDLVQRSRSRISRSFSPVRDLLHRMDTSPACNDPTLRQELLVTRTRALDDVEIKLNSWVEDAMALKERVAEAERAELRRLEQERIAEEKRLQAERERLAEEERARLERELREAEERERKERAERERLEAEERARLEREERERLEEEERQRLQREQEEREARERAEAEENARLEREERERREEEERLRLQKEQEESEAREAAERAEKERQEEEERQRLLREQEEKEARERAEAEEKARLEREERERQEEEERLRLQREKEEREAREAAERAEKERQEEEERQRLLREKEEEEARERAEAEEKARLEMEERERRAEEERLRLQRQREKEEREAQEAAERAEKERREEEERQRLLREKEEKEAQERAEAEEKARLEREERERQEEEERLRLQREQEERDAQEAAERAEKERHEEEERQRLLREREERERAEAEEKARLERAERERQDAERLRLQKEKEEQEAREHAEAEERERLEREEMERQKDEEERKRQFELAAQERLEAAEREAEARRLREAYELQASTSDLSFIAEELTTPTQQFEEDVFGFRIIANDRQLSAEMLELQDRITSLRTRLVSISLNANAKPSSSADSSLPTDEQRTRIAAKLSAIVSEGSQLPGRVSEPQVDAQLQSLRSDIDSSSSLMARIHQLADFGLAVHACDAALSDLLEHIDSYPAPPAGPLSSSHVSLVMLPPEEQLAARLKFTKECMDAVTAALRSISDDERAVVEHDRLLQMWLELEDMANDRIKGRKSRPSSVISSGRESRTSVGSTRSGMSAASRGSTISRGSTVSRGSGSTRGSGLKTRGSALPRKKADYGSLTSASRPPKRVLLPPKPPNSQRSTSGHIPASRPVSQASLYSNRSVSGPSNGTPVKRTVMSDASRLYGPTIASRQRTSSTASNASTVLNPSRRTSGTLLLPHKGRSGSPTPSELSTLSQSTRSARSTSLSHGTWARASTARLSFPTTPRHTATPPPKKKKEYIPNAKNKLDVAVSHVVNKMPVDIRVSVAEESWKDQAGKYWIGAEEDTPKLCYCRILRSQMVMVRVGGGWMELSKFITIHFADLFRGMPNELSPRGREEKWISAASLKAQSESPDLGLFQLTPARPPRTPEPGQRPSHLPSFSLSTPSGKSPHSVASLSPGSPLVSMQLMKRAEAMEQDPAMHPTTPTRPHTRQRTITNTPRTPAWRP